MTDTKNKVITAFSGLAAGLCNGFFGSGGGTLIVPCMEKFLGVKTHRAHATAIAVILPLSAVSGLIYFGGVDIPYKSAALACIGSFAGGLLGARLLGRIKGRTLHILFGILMITGGVRMLC